jgi:toxin-antitoxin system PIN domain toxin
LSRSAKRRVQPKPEQVHLLDGNVLVALVGDTHVHHAAAQHWFASQQQPFATCPITQGTLIRVLMSLGELRAEQATQVLAGLIEHPRHRFWPDSIPYDQVTWAGVIGHRQVTDAYLAALARHHRGRLVTFDGGLAGLHTDVAVGLSA